MCLSYNLLLPTISPKPPTHYQTRRTCRGSYFLSETSLSSPLSDLSSQLSTSKMQSTALTFSSSNTIPKHRTPLNPTPNSRFDPIRIISSSSKSHDRKLSSNVTVSASLSRRSWSLNSTSSSSSPSSSFKFRPWSPVPAVSSDGQTDRIEVRAASVPERAGESAESISFSKTLVLGSLFGLWYLFNIYFNIYNKQVIAMLIAWKFIVSFPQFWEISYVLDSFLKFFSLLNMILLEFFLHLIEYFWNC